LITGDLTSQIDNVLEAIWTGAHSNTITVIEQMSYMVFIGRIDEYIFLLYLRPPSTNPS